MENLLEDKRHLEKYSNKPQQDGGIVSNTSLVSMFGELGRIKRLYKNINKLFIGGYIEDMK